MTLVLGKEVVRNFIDSLFPDFLYKILLFIFCYIFFDLQNHFRIFCI